MVKVMGNLNRWLTKESLQEMLGWSQESVDLLIDGLSKSTAVTPGGLILINLNDLYNYLSEVKKLTDPLLKGSVSKKIKKPKAEKKPKPEKMNRKQRVDAGYLTGKQAAEKLDCSYAAIIEFIKKHGLKAGKFGRGWYITPKDLEEFSSKNQDLIKSFQDKKDEAIKQEETKNQEVPAKEEKKKEEPEEDPSSFAPVPKAVVTEENIIIVDPSPDSGQNSNPDQEKNEEDKRCSFVSIKKTKHGCRVDDVAVALKLSISTPMRWITDNQVKTINGPGPKGDERYIEPKSLEEFLLKQRNTIVTFDEVRGADHVHLPDSHNSMRTH